MDKKIACKGCEKLFLMRSLVQHAERSKCRATYSDEELANLKKRLKEITSANKKLKDAQRHKKNYDPIKRSQEYIKDKTKISESYNPIKCSEDYRKNKTSISLKRKELEQNKKSEGGRIFSKLSDWVFSDVFHNFKCEHFVFAYEMEEEERDFYEDEAMWDVFNDELWLSNFDKQTFDCEDHLKHHKSDKSLTCDELALKISQERGREQFCFLHISEKKIGELIEESIDERYKEEVEKMMTENAKDAVEKEMKLAFDSGYSPTYLPVMYSEVRKRCLKKAFRTLFVKEQNETYKKAYESALNKFRESGHDREKENFLIDELEDLGVYVASEIYNMFRIDFMNTLEKEFLSFKRTLPSKMRAANKRRKEWVIKMLTKIEKNEEASMNKEKKTLFEEAKVQVEQIYEKYENEISEAFDNCKVPFDNFFSFTEVVDEYPNLDFLNTGGKDLLFHFALWDKYRVLESETWKKIENTKQKCVCNVCTKNLHCTAECERIISQRLKGNPFRTCPFCQMQIVKGHFERRYGHNSNAHIMFLSTSEMTCAYSEADKIMCKKCKDHLISIHDLSVGRLDGFRGCPHKKQNK